MEQEFALQHPGIKLECVIGDVKNAARVAEALAAHRPGNWPSRSRTACKRPKFVQGDIRDAALLDRIFAESSVRAVIHFAGLKAVGESVEKPLECSSNAETSPKKPKRR